MIEDSLLVAHAEGVRSAHALQGKPRVPFYIRGRVGARGCPESQCILPCEKSTLLNLGFWGSFISLFWGYRRGGGVYADHDESFEKREAWPQNRVGSMGQTCSYDPLDQENLVVQGRLFDFRGHCVGSPGVGEFHG